ncbi:MAG: DUF4258 domain-containing protein [Leptospiraceae bacterium]|nr:DUF4258 domain-containing protein [Leptospiraceae bacterium]
MEKIIAEVRSAANSRILFLPHALRQMSRLDRMISAADVKRTVMTGKFIESYPEDPRGHSCLILGQTDDKRPVHVVCSPKSDYLAIITAYIPSDDLWTTDFESRLIK